VAVCAGYYAGALIGLQLRIPNATPSVLWPPNAILAAALLLSEPRRWPLLLLAALPAHLAVQLKTEWPISLIVALFFTNCLEALIAAGGTRLLSDAPTRFDSLRRLVAFTTAAVFAAPLLSSFADAAVVHVFRGEPYWAVWQNRLFSNMLAELTIVPAIVGVVTEAPHWIGAPDVRRIREAAAVALGLMVTGWLAMRAEPSPDQPLKVLASGMPLALQLPFLFWAALRFGSTGTGLSLLMTSTLSAWALAHGFGPFASFPPALTVTALTWSLLVVAGTLMCCATLIQERRRSQHALSARLRFEELLSQLSRSFVQMPSDVMDRAIDGWLGRIGVFLEVDCVALLVADHDNRRLVPAHSWTGPRMPAPPVGITASSFPKAMATIQSFHTVAIADVHALKASEIDREPLLTLGLTGAAAAPIFEGDRLIGALVAGSVERVPWAGPLADSLRLVGEVLGNVLERKRAEDALRASELMKAAILESLKTGVVVVDAVGTVVAHNRSWKELARRCGCVDVDDRRDMLGALAAAEQSGSRLARDMRKGLIGVLDGSRPLMVLEHSANDTDRSWALVIVPLACREGAVLTRADITDVRQAERAAQRSHRELAHVTRVSTMGELTASLAHQINQPLTAIRTNAQVARRLLDSDRPDVPEVRNILSDIVNDERRASDVITSVRSLLRKGELDMTSVDLPGVIREVASLIDGEMMSRNVSLRVHLDDDPIPVHGDRVHLQQVVLNLLQNALEATGDRSRPDRVVRLTCRRIDHRARVTVEDSGPGLRPGEEEIVFEPFFTTKGDGMGMGLAIVRSIVEAHGGTVHAANGGQAGGALFEVTLPIVDAGID